MKHQLISTGIGNKDSGVTLELKEFVNLAEYLQSFSEEVIDPMYKDSREWFAPFILKPGTKYRTIPSINYLTNFISVDIDTQGWTIERIIEKFHNTNLIAYTTTKSKPEWQRWRVVFFTTRDYSVEEHGAIWNYLNDKFEKSIDAKTKDASRISYVPAKWIGADNQLHVIDGKFLNIDDILINYKPIEIKPPLEPISKIEGEKVKGEIFTKKMVDDFISAPEGGRFYHLLCSAASYYCRNGWQLSAYELCQEALKISRTYAPKKKRNNAILEAEKALAWATNNVKPMTALERFNNKRIGKLKRGNV